MKEYENLKIIEFRKALRDYVAKAQLPEEVKRMVLEQCLQEQGKKTLEAAKGEIAERDKEEGEYAESL